MLALIRSKLDGKLNTSTDPGAWRVATRVARTARRPHLQRGQTARVPMTIFSSRRSAVFLDEQSPTACNNAVNCACPHMKAFSCATPCQLASIPNGGTYD
eukprot:scaffold30644_cov67-Phaeocystis_antarctica.AAC.10